MADKDTQPTPPATEQMTSTISAEEFAAYKAKVEADLAAARTETFALRQARRLDQLTAKYDAFIALPVKGSELAEKFMALEAHDPKLYEFFDGLLATADKALGEAKVFDQFAHGRQPAESRGAETFETLAARLLAEKFDGDISKQSDANALAGQQRPDLRHAYLYGGKEK